LNAPFKIGQKHDHGDFGSLAEFLIAVREAEVGGRIDPRLRAAHGANEGNPADGGFLIPEVFSTNLITSIYEGSIFWPLCETDVRSGTGPLGGIRVPGIDETSRADGSRFGGAASAWAAEDGQISASKPRFKSIEFKPHKLLGFVFGTNELIADAPLFDSHVRRALVAELSFKIDTAIVSGSGAGLPLGMLNSPALITVAKDTGQAAGTITASNLSGMWKRLPGPSRKNAVWLVHEDVTEQLDGLVALGQLNPALYQPAGTNGSRVALLKGAPMIDAEQCQPVGTPGDIILADLTQYLVIVAAPKIALSAHFHFDQDESVFRFALRVDGKGVYSSPITPFNGSTTRSPFVAIAQR
jgi:HK97 family phage major capsid protein